MFAVLGVLLVVALIVFGIYLGKVSGEFDAAVNAVAADFRESGISATSIEKIATSQYLEELTGGTPNSLDKFSSMLGALKSLGTCQTMQVTIENDQGSGTAQCSATFERETGTLILEMQLQDRKWLLSGLSVQL